MLLLIYAHIYMYNIKQCSVYNNISIYTMFDYSVHYIHRDKYTYIYMLFPALITIEQKVCIYKSNNIYQINEKMGTSFTKIKLSQYVRFWHLPHRLTAKGD